MSFHEQEKGFSQKKLLPPNFKNFSKSLNKKILFLPDTKPVYTSRNEELVKKRLVKKDSETLGSKTLPV